MARRERFVWAAWGTVLALGLGASTASAAVEVQARLARRNLTVVETTTLEVAVRGAVTGIREPEFVVPRGLEVLGTGRSQSFSTVNGRMTLETVYRFELAPNGPGSYRIGPIQVRVGGQVYQSQSVMLTVVAEHAQLGESSGEPASLVVDVTPREPYVGQAVIMRVRLIQRAALAEDPRYEPPPTTGFWGERSSEPESYYATQGRARVLVTETRTRLYPLGIGEATVGEAVASLALAAPRQSFDPLQWMGGRPSRRDVTVRSAPVKVRVRPLPPGAGPGFDGAVGRFSAAWRADRARTTQDVPVTVRFDVSGVGNLPLIHTPDFQPRDFEVYASTVDDSLARAGSLSNGRRRFQWTVLARRQGSLVLEPPTFSWFDPDAGAYRRLALNPIALEVGPPLGSGSAPAEVFPGAFTAHPLDPLQHPGQPWAFALAGLALGLAVRMWRGASRVDEVAAERARQRQWMQAMRGSGPDFWGAADRACGWLEEHGRSVRSLRGAIEASRYGGARADEKSVRTKLLEELTRALPAPRPRWIPRLGAVVLAVAAVALCVGFAPRSGDPRGVNLARAADQAAREGDLGRARSEWLRLWRAGSRAPGLAARLAWVEAQSGAIGPASLWVLRGDRGEPRDPALEWMVRQIREAGGLTGFVPSRLPVRLIEWALLALLAGLGAALAWPRRWAASAALGGLVLAVAIFPLQGWLADRRDRAVVKSDVMLEGPNLELEPGQVVTVLERESGRARAEAGRGVSGWVPWEAIDVLEDRQ